jgi:hypothetical protein
MAIDPGNKVSAYVIWDGREIGDMDIKDNGDLLDMLRGMLCHAELLVVEQVKSYGMAVGDTIFDTVFWSGRFVQAWPGQWDRMPRMDVKMHLCHSSRAKDTNIRQALIDRFGVPGTKKKPGLTYGLKKDLWAAFGLAVTAYDKIHARAHED